MSTRCKFKCESVKHDVNGGSVVLVPVTSTNPENSLFFKWTPHGKFEMGTINKDVIAMFVPGEDYYIDITPAK